MSLIRKLDQHPVFTAEGCREVFTHLHVDFAQACPEVYKNEEFSWKFNQIQIDKLVKTPKIFGSTSAFGYLVGACNNLRWNDSVSHALFVGTHLSILPILDDFIWRSGFKDAIEGVLFMEWPNVVHAVTQDPESRIVTVFCRQSGGLRGGIKKMTFGYPSPTEVLNRLKEFFGEQYFIQYKHAIHGNQVRLAVFYNICEESVDEAKTAKDPVSEFRREIINLAWKSSGNV